MTPIALDWSRCPDGAEFVDYGVAPPGKVVMASFGLHIRHRSEKRAALRLETADLENPVVLHFLNARTDDDLLRFVGRFGMLGDWHEERREKLVDWQTFIRICAFQSLKAPPEDRASVLNQLTASISLSPSVETLAGGSAPRLVLRPQTLGGFIRMEIVAAWTAGVDITSCEHCDKLFFTGPLTGRRSHAKFCSDRCRVGAMRKRNASKPTVRN